MDSIDYERHTMTMKKTVFMLALLIFCTNRIMAQSSDPMETGDTKIQICEEMLTPEITCMVDTDCMPATIEPVKIDFNDHEYQKSHRLSIYDLPYSFTGTCYDWKRFWINTATLTGAFVGTLFVLECLPEDATNWNRADIQSTPLFKRWKEHVIDEGPEWDGDKWYFNYLLHPYAGAAYFMGARSCGFNFWQSFLYSAFISTVEWEYGIEAFMERPSIQDLFITPIVGSLIGEGFYLLKRNIVQHGYRLAGSKVLGNIVAFLIDPLNQFLGLFYGNPSRAAAKLYEKKIDLSSSFIVSTPSGPRPGIGITCVF